MELPIEKLLKGKRIEYKLIKLKQNAYTVDDVVRYSAGVRPDEICKTLILRGKKTGRKFAIFLRGCDRIDFPKTRKLFGEETGIASPEEVGKAAGVSPGAVCPFLLNLNVPLFVDGKVMVLQKINCGSGHHLYGLEFRREDLAKGVSYQLVDLSKAHAE